MKDKDNLAAWPLPEQQDPRFTTEIKPMMEPDKKDTPRPFPYWPPQPVETMLHRMELQHQLNMWENNNPVIAKQVAGILINLLKDQFNLHEEDTPKHVVHLPLDPAILQGFKEQQEEWNKRYNKPTVQ